MTGAQPLAFEILSPLYTGSCLKKTSQKKQLHFISLILIVRECTKIIFSVGNHIFGHPCPKYRLWSHCWYWMQCFHHLSKRIQVKIHILLNLLSVKVYSKDTLRTLTILCIWNADIFHFLKKIAAITTKQPFIHLIGIKCMKCIFLNLLLWKNYPSVT